MQKDILEINGFHHYNKSKGLLYLNEKELYLSKNEMRLFSCLFENFDKEVPYESIDIKDSIRQTVVSGLNQKIKGLIVRNIKDKSSLILTSK